MRQELARVNGAHNRVQIVSLLDAMGVPIPSRSKLSANALRRKLTTALDFSHHTATFSSRFPLDANVLPDWMVCTFHLDSPSRNQ